MSAVRPRAASTLQQLAFTSSARLLQASSCTNKQHIVQVSEVGARGRGKWYSRCRLLQGQLLQRYGEMQVAR
jgi:hypothetical protein